MNSWLDEKYIRAEILERRDYQTRVADIALARSTLVVLPTGMGKTIIATIILSRKLDEGNAVFLAPTKPLALQHYEFLMENLTLPEGDIELFTGETKPSKRGSLWRMRRIIVSTPQVVQNDIISGVKDLGDISLMIFDEAHRAVGNYAYAFIGEKYRQQRKGGLVLGMTASPGADPKRIREVCENLGIERIEIRSKWDEDVRPYVHEIRMSWIEVDLPEKMKKVKAGFDSVLGKKIASLRKMGLVRGRNVGVTQLLEIQRIIRARLHAEGKAAPKFLYQALSIQAQAMKINHAVELLTTQDTRVLNDYLDKLRSEARNRGSTKAARTLVEDPDFKYAMALAQLGQWAHPKLPKVKEAIKAQFLVKEDSRIILFTQYRGTADILMNALADMPGIRPEKFVGQRDTEWDKGLKQREQIEVIRKFRRGEINVLIATSVAEEGLDIPSTDLVIFYEPVPSEIRTIQRRGRTGRKRAGRVLIFITKGTRDEAYYWTARNKEKRMRREIGELKREFRSELITLPGGMDDKEKKGWDRSVRDRTGEKGSKNEAVGLKMIPENAHGVLEPVPGYPGSDGGDVPVKDNIPDVRRIDVHRSGLRYYPEKQNTKKAGSSDRAGFGDPPIETPGKGQTSLVDFSADDKLIMVVDNREFNSEVVKHLSKMGVIVRSRQLEVGDYVISDRVAVERKEAGDFLSSMLDGYLFAQLRKLRSYQSPVLVIEGDGLFSTRNISDEAIFGALSAITISLGIPVINTKDAQDTARFLVAGAKRENAKGREIRLRSAKATMNMRERQQFILEGLPHISAKLAKRLIQHFGSVRAVFDASVEELTAVKGIGEIVAGDIRKAIDSDQEL